MKYIATLAQQFSNEYDQKCREQKERYQLLIDKPSENEDDVYPIIDYLSYKQQTSKDDVFNTDHTLLDLAEDETLYNSLKKLTNKERKVLEFIFIYQLKQVEISDLFGDTPQNIGKIKKRALKKIKESYRKEVSKNVNKQAYRQKGNIN
ncbi:MAG TPA: sigma factor-like helix-turn-helix DNA-binding protein [Bacillus sp. (in: firmicutes)]|nr:sigma factor-like helix-turn-helix DNA-binding protein [Bacillus sp. (in: firmicutes)]